jgi:hypothetical protein
MYNEYNERDLILEKKFDNKQSPDIIVVKYWIVDRTNKLSSRLPPSNYDQHVKSTKPVDEEVDWDSELAYFLPDTHKSQLNDEGNTSAESSQFSSTSDSVIDPITHWYKSNKKTYNHPIHLNKSKLKSISPSRRTIRKHKDASPPKDASPDKESSPYY